jgi:hypothetical protein
MISIAPAGDLPAGVFLWMQFDRLRVVKSF